MFFPLSSLQLKTKYCSSDNYYVKNITASPAVEEKMFLGSPNMTSQSYRGGGQGFCDDSSKALVMKWVTMGVKKCSELRDVIYGQLLRCYGIFFLCLLTKNRCTVYDEITKIKLCLFVPCR